MKKKLLNIIFIIAMLISVCFLLAGCGKTANEDNKESSSNEKKEQIEQVDEEEENEKTAIGVSGYFVKYKDDIYYWKINEDSRETSNLGGNFYDIVNVQNELIKVDKNGKEETILKDKGNGKIFILNDRIYVNYATSGYNQVKKIYSVDLNGKDKQELATGEMRYFIGDYIYCVDQSANGRIFSINAKDGEIKNLVQNSDIVGCVNETIIYEENEARGSLKIGIIKDNSDNGIVTTFYPTDFEVYTSQVLHIENVFGENEKISVYICYRDGSANLIQEICKLTMDADGKNVQQSIMGEYDSLYSIEDSREAGAVFMKYRQIGTSITNYTYKLAYNDVNTGELNEVVDLDDISSEYNFIDDDEHIIELYEGSIIGDEIYAIFDYDEHDSSGDIGWRYAYKRLRTVVFKYNIKTGKYTTIYEF